eukprot:52853-Chlamydomonas_euryale.AAC.11
MARDSARVPWGTTPVAKCGMTCDVTFALRLHVGCRYDMAFDHKWAYSQLVEDLAAQLGFTPPVAQADDPSGDAC